MPERPDALSLLEAARTTMIGELLPRLQGDDRTTALMIAKALSIASRELGGEPAALRVVGAATTTDEALRQRLRAGQMPDADGVLRAALLEFTRARLRISNPKLLATLESLYADDAQ